MSDSIAPPGEQEARAFTVVSTNALGQPHILPPQACNPAMDLAVLLCEPSDEESGPNANGVPSLSKGKGKASAGFTTQVSLWRLSGAKVWEVEVTGRVLGLTWSIDGLILSLLVLRLNGMPSSSTGPGAMSKSSLEHLSVHTGEVTKTIPVPSGLLEAVSPEDLLPSSERHGHFDWWPMEWVPAADQWPSHKPGAPLMVIDSLPGVTPVEPPKPAIINPFAIPSAADAKKKKGLHEKLGNSPALLSSSNSAPPNVLTIHEPPRGKGAPTAAARLLTGTFVLPPGASGELPSSILDLAVRADTITRLLDVVFRGFESCAAAYKDANRETFRWRDELEICGQQQGVSPADVHADLFRFLMTGQSGVAVGEWLGNRLTNRPVAKWDSSVQTGFLTIQKVLAESVIPALERVLLLLEELNGWAHDLLQFDVVLDGESISRATAQAKGLLVLCEDMRQASSLEWETAVEWFKWIRHEMKRLISSEDDVVPPTYDLKLVWSFMVNGFVNSRFKLHFPNVMGAADEHLPAGFPHPVPPSATDLNAVMASTLASLTAPSRRGSEHIASPTPGVPDKSYNSSHASPLPPMSPEQPPSSPDTVGDNMAPPEIVEAPRQPELEPWAWANTLLATCNSIVAAARLRSPASEHGSKALLDGLAPGSFLEERTIDGSRWILQMASTSALHVLARDESDPDVLRLARFAMVDGGEIVQAAFYGDEEVALVVQRGTQRYLAMALVADMSAQLHALSWESGVDLAWATTLEPTELVLSRSRLLGTAKRRAGSYEPWLLAVNARDGRRSGWVLTQGGESLDVFDLDTNEDDEEEEDEDEEAVEDDVGMEE